MIMLILLLLPILDIYIHRLLWKINKWLYIDMYISNKEDRQNIQEVLKKYAEEDNKLDVWERF